ncbi:MAG: type II toxin-antitoxin system RelB/DinJ family antitoxin [Kiritimatiellae bacterium]|nr:type II toxin-antitoxin system RelB/DinJ family antitoxin [Kiritimatiellia bacterium]
MNSATIAFRVKPEIKRRADELFSHLGMTTSTAMNVLLMQTLAHRGFAAPVVLPDIAAERPNETTVRAIEDLDNNRDLSRYASVDAMLKDVL